MKSYTLLIFLFTYYLSNSQNIQSLENIKNIVKSSSRSSVNYSRAVDLIENLHPKLYINKLNEKSTSKNNTYACEIDIDSLSKLINKTDLSDLEIITIKIENPTNQNINIDELKNKFQKLKFIHLIYEYPLNNDSINISSTNNSVLVIYSVSVNN